eukprot:TRINITY_DN10438_c0_g1_i1.p1 TRINITY_DN10438_c0_g1~~TRINITY_DN10438_c0_g1_i1.p1  ORF type:complete len:324 (+),score=120.36 TRINITY_DN10438_c0_g1_i1:81-1052(+)
MAPKKAAAPAKAPAAAPGAAAESGDGEFAMGRECAIDLLAQIIVERLEAGQSLDEITDESLWKPLADEFQEAVEDIPEIKKEQVSEAALRARYTSQWAEMVAEAKEDAMLSGEEIAFLEEMEEGEESSEDGEGVDGKEEAEEAEEGDIDKAVPAEQKFSLEDYFRTAARIAQLRNYQAEKAMEKAFGAAAGKQHGAAAQGEKEPVHPPHQLTIRKKKAPAPAGPTPSGESGLEDGQDTPAPTGTRAERLQAAVANGKWWRLMSDFTAAEIAQFLVGKGWATAEEAKQNKPELLALVKSKSGACRGAGASPPPGKRRRCVVLVE